MFLLNKMKGFSISRVLPLMLALFLCLTQALPVLAFTIPKQNAAFYVNDTADLMDDEEENYIIAASEDLYSKTGAQVVVVTVKSLEGASIEEYATELFRSYGIGDAEKNNGVLFLLSLDDRECRIEVGYGLEGAINDAKAGRIMDKYMIPYFKEGKWGEGIVNGADAIFDEICTEYDVTIEHNEPKVPAGTNTESEKGVDSKTTMGFIFSGIAALVGGMIVGYIFEDHSLIPGIIFLIIEAIVLIAVLTPGYAILFTFFSVVAYIFGWCITSPDIGEGYSSGSSYSSSSGSSSSSRSHSSYNSGGGGRSGGGGASRKF